MLKINAVFANHQKLIVWFNSEDYVGYSSRLLESYEDSTLAFEPVANERITFISLN